MVVSQRDGDVREMEEGGEDVVQERGRGREREDKGKTIGYSA
jgi:hypothetical protein